MKEYINKDALLAEIERRLEALANTSAGNNREFAAIIGAQHYELINLIQFINTLEVKEINSTDTFIKKVEDYLNSQLYDWVSITNPDQRSYVNVIPKEDFIEGFRNYMEE